MLIDCKIVGADRLAEQMHGKTNLNTICGARNELAVESAPELLPEKSKKRCLAETRRGCYGEDKFMFQYIWPLLVKVSITLEETSACVEVASRALISAITQLIFPGSQYCAALASNGQGGDYRRPKLFLYVLTAESCGRRAGSKRSSCELLFSLKGSRGVGGYSRLRAAPGVEFVFEV